MSFRPAIEECATAGSLRYCVYKAAAGTSKDILYHLPGRNLDEKIWNDNTYYTGLLQSEWQRDGALPPTVVTVVIRVNLALNAQGSKERQRLA